MNWRLFIGACVLTSGLLIKIGAPPPAVVMGVLLAGFFTWRRQRS